jgi:hypothetical protein
VQDLSLSLSLFSLSSLSSLKPRPCINFPAPIWRFPAQKRRFPRFPLPTAISSDQKAATSERTRTGASRTPQTMSIVSTPSGPEAAAARQTISRKPGAYIKDPVRYKTQVCQNFANRGKCPYNKKCQFAHGADELRCRPEQGVAGASTSPPQPPAPPPLLPPAPPPPPPPRTPTLIAAIQPPLPPPLPTMLPRMPPLPLAPSPRTLVAAPTIRQVEAPFSMMALGLEYGADAAGAASAAPPVPPAPAAPVAPAAAALAAPTSPAATAAAPFSLDSCRDDEDASDLLRLDHVTGRVEIEMPFCGREPSYNSESLRRQISFLFDEPGLPAQGRNDPVLQDAAWALNWGGTSRAATAA